MANMEDVIVQSEEEIVKTIRSRKKSNQWYVLRFEGYAFKIFGYWAQLLVTPGGLKNSGVHGHTSAKALDVEIQQFINATKVKAGD